MNMRTRLRLPLTAGLAVAAVLAAPAAAQADSIAYIKDGNVWLRSPDGAKVHQVTKDGTAQDPYRSPSQADDGTLAVSRGYEILILEQNGQVLRRLDPPRLSDSTSSPLKGVPVDIAISPDGSKVAYQFVSYSCPIGTSCGARSAVGVTDSATGTTAPSSYSAPLYLQQPSWYSNNRLLAFDGYLHQVNTIDIGPGAKDVHWFDDETTDLGDGEATRQGDKFAIVRGYDTDTEAGTHLLWYRLNGQLAGAQPTPAQKPASVCSVAITRETHDPTWSPDGSTLVWSDVDGIFMIRNVTTDDTQCATQAIESVVPGAGEPDYGPADVAPRPIDTGGGGGRPDTGGGGGQPDTGGGGSSFAAALPSKAKLRTALKGLRLTAQAPGAGSVSAKATLPRSVARRLKVKTTVATGQATACNAGAVKLTLKFPKATQKRLTRARSLKVTVTLVYQPKGGGAKQSVKRAVTLR
jgi:hypothetical protein